MFREISRWVIALYPPSVDKQIMGARLHKQETEKTCDTQWGHEQLTVYVFGGLVYGIINEPPEATDRETTDWEAPDREATDRGTPDRETTDR